MKTLVVNDISLLFNVTGAKGKLAVHDFVKLKEAKDSRNVYFTQLRNNAYQIFRNE